MVAHVFEVWNEHSFRSCTSSILLHPPSPSVGHIASQCRTLLSLSVRTNTRSEMVVRLKADDCDDGRADGKTDFAPASQTPTSGLGAPPPTTHSDREYLMRRRPCSRASYPHGAECSHPTWHVVCVLLVDVRTNISPMYLPGLATRHWLVGSREKLGQPG